MSMAKVLVVTGSESDLGELEPAWKVLEELGIAFEVRVASASAHRTPDVVEQLAKRAREDGFGVVIAAAGGAAHLAGVFAALTTLPVVAVPIASGALRGMDALVSSTQMPPGIPLAAVGIGVAKNAGLYAAAILGVTDAGVAARIDEFRRAMHKKVTESDARVRARLGDPSRGTP
jgi:5-(carboxyamino)imidazole ribonucleotide mutase